MLKRIELLCSIYSLTAVFVFREERGRSVCVQRWSTCDMFVFFCLCLRVSVEGAECSVRPPTAGAAAGSHSPRSDSLTGTVRTRVAGVLVAKRTSTECKEKRRTAALSTDVNHATLVRGRHPWTLLRRLFWDQGRFKKNPCCT